jgi:integrase
MVADLRYSHADAILATMAHTPAAANNLRKVLIRLMDFAVKTEMATRNPVRATRTFKTNPEGWHTWTEAEIEQFEQRHILGTKARLALALLLYTGQRRSDVVRLGRQHIRDGKITLTQQKTHSKLTLPVHSELAAAIEAMPRHEHLTFLVTSFGKPFTAAGFGNWFRDRCDEAGLPQCSAHGLRKAISRRMAEMGLSHSQGKAVTGHVTDKEFTRYSRAADQERLAEQAMANLETRLAISGRKRMKKNRKSK